MQLEPGRNHPHLNLAERLRNSQGAQRPREGQGRFRPDLAQQGEAALRSDGVRPSPRASEGSGGGEHPPGPQGPSPAGARGQPPEIIATRRADGAAGAPSTRPSAGESSGAVGARWSRLDQDPIPRGLKQLMEVQTMSQPEVLGRGARLDIMA